MLSSSFDVLQLADRIHILSDGGFLVKRIASTEPRVERGVFLYNNKKAVFSTAFDGFRITLLWRLSFLQLY